MSRLHCSYLDQLLRPWNLVHLSSTVILITMYCVTLYCALYNVHVCLNISMRASNYVLLLLLLLFFFFYSCTKAYKA
jgi:hypothetical protein